MKKVIYFAASLAAAGILFASFMAFKFPKVGKAPNIKVIQSPETIIHGEYFTMAVAACVDCHSPRNWDKNGEVYPDSLFAGSNNEFTSKYGFPGDFYAPNLTPFHLGSWTDGEIFRAITCGVNKDNKPLFPVMPYHNYGKMTKEDVYTIIAFLRNLPTVNKITPESNPEFPVNILMKTFPEELKPISYDSSDLVSRGKYLFIAASCGDCHHKSEQGKIVEGMEFAGGNFYDTPLGSCVSANISPDKEEGIGTWTKETFISRFKKYKEITKNNPSKQNTVMPWAAFSQMEATDIEAIFEYLKIQRPIKSVHKSKTK